MMDRLRMAVQGNSTTARQLAELGLAGGAGLVAGGGNPLDLKALATGALVYGLRRGSAEIDARVARRVGGSFWRVTIPQYSIKLSISSREMAALRLRSPLPPNSCPAPAVPAPALCRVRRT